MSKSKDPSKYNIVKCRYCIKSFERRTCRQRGRAMSCLRPMNSVTCSKFCSRHYGRIYNIIKNVIRRSK